MEKLFISNSYTEEYYKIIVNANQRVPQTATRTEAKKILEYTERHHIIPRSLGGTEDCNNLAWLTAAEHLKVHLLLVNMVSEIDHLRKMNLAAVRMSNPQSKTQKRIIGDSLIEEIGNIRIESAKLHADYMKEKHKGKLNPMYGKHHSNSSKDAKRKAMTGLKRTEENKKNCSKSKIGDKNPGVKIVTCPKCNTTGKAGGMRKHHFDHCKNHLIYKFSHRTSGIEFIGTKNEFIEANLQEKDRSNVNNLIRTRQGAVKGWMIEK